MAKTYITDVTLRDAHQCLIATRLRTTDMLPICNRMNAVGFWAMEVWGGATFDACLRFLQEDPWERLRLLRDALPDTRLSMLLRGQNLLGYRHYADDVVQQFIKLATKNGVDVFRIFDALNDVRNLQTAISSIKKNKKHAQGAICYTTSPVHSLEKFIETGEKLAELGCDSLAIKDMAGLLTPSMAVALYQGLSKATNLPIHLHSHATSGLANICHYQAVLAGCSHIDTAISSFSGGASHPATETLVAALAETQFSTGLDLNLLLEIDNYFREIRKKYSQYESEAREIDPQVQLYQVPGGMISNLYNQLKEQQALDKLAAVHSEIPKVRKDLGYPPLVTPTSQIVGTQALLNVLSGERYHTITNEVKWYCQGKYGLPPGKINPKLRKKAIGNTEVIEVRPADLLPREFKRLTQEAGELAQSTEDVLTFAMFPEIGKDFLHKRQNHLFLPEIPPESITPAQTPLSEFDISLHGENYHIKVAGFGQRDAQHQACFLWVDDVPEEVLIRSQTATEPLIVKTSSKKAGDITVSMPGTILSLSVKAGELVKKGQTLFVLEAMKMETEIQAPFAGIVQAVHCQVGAKITPDTVVCEIAKS